MKTNENSHTYDVIISGAGPVGLFLACELALAKCSVLILEKSDNPLSALKRLPYGVRGLSAPTIEALYRRNLLKDLEVHKHLKSPHKTGAPTEGPRRQVGHFAGIPFLEGDVDTTQWKLRLPGSPPTNLISTMEEMETVLSRRAEELGVAIERGLAVQNFQQSAEGVTVHAGNNSFRTKYLVGCDGARSIIRKLAGFEFAGTEPEFTGYTTQVDMADPQKLKPGRNMTSHGMYLQSQPGFVIIQDFDGGAFHGSDKPITLEHVQEVLRRVSETDVTLTALHLAATWTDRARQATTYRNGRILLAGDAAHIHAPLGGQGLNLGIGDAMNLGWKLAATIHGNAAEGLLDTYESERIPIGMNVLDWSRAQVAIMNPTPQARALNAIFRDLLATRDGATYFASRVWGVNTHYDLGDSHPLIGYSVPNFPLEDGTTIGELLRDAKGVMLDFASNPALRTFASEYAARLNYVSGHTKNQLGLTAALVRPDGYIAWATDATPDLVQLKLAASRWFVA
jgi:2-polyprenyl-6-methoxyphenol hydroxylase-like FAD-dependent oxidoreductase